MTHREYRELMEESPEKAQRKLFDEYFSYVYAIAFNRLRSCGSREDVEECVSDIFSGIYSHYSGDIPAEGDIKGFISTVAGRKSIAYFRRLSRLDSGIQLDDELSAVLPSDEDVEDSLELKEKRQTIIAAIDSLGEPDSAIILQKFYYGRNSREISEIVRLSPMMIRVRCSRALKKLRKKLTDAGIKL